MRLTDAQARLVPNLVIELNRRETDYDPQGWLPAAEMPTVASVRQSFERGRSPNGKPAD